MRACSNPSTWLQHGYLMDVEGTDDIIFSCMEQFQAAKKGPAAKPEAVRRWCNDTEMVVEQLKRRAGELGYKQVPQPTTSGLLSAKEAARWEGAIELSAALGSAGRHKTKPHPQVKNYMASKRETYNEWKADGTHLDEFVLKCQEFYQHVVKTKDPTAFVQTVVLKDEPVKLKKLSEGRHRTVGAPDWVIQAVDMRCCMFEKDGKFYSLDFVMSRVKKFSMNGRTVNYAGVETPIESVEFLLQSQKGGSTDGDVKGWDRTIPIEVISTMYCALFGSSIGDVFARGLCGEGLYKIGGNVLRWISPTVAFCSGCLRTLTGNSIINAALAYRCGARKASVKGDDMVLLGGDYTAAVMQVYGDVGLTVQELRYIPTGASFISFDTRSPEFVDIECLSMKMYARCSSEDEFRYSFASIWHQVVLMVAEVRR